MAFSIYLSPPNMCGTEREMVKEAFDTNWIAPYGPHLGKFEEEMAAYVGVEAALAVNSGTSAIHLALQWLGVKEGDLVFCSDFTFIGSCNPILYLGGTPVFIDSEPDTWNMSPLALERALKWAEQQGKLPKAVIVVDLYGESANWDRILPLCRQYGIPVLEDAAEALGSVYRGKRCGSFGDVNVLSFNGNKIITTSGGGMVLSHDTSAIAKMRFWSTQSREPVMWYRHEEIGFNYRMSNVSAAIGRGQLTALEYKVKRRTEIRDRYEQALKGLPVYIKKSAEPGSNYWLSLLYIKDLEISPIAVVTALQNAGIESRPAWKPMHLQPIFKGELAFSHHEEGFVSAEVFHRVLCLPSGDGMTEAQQDHVIKEVKRIFENVRSKSA